MKEKKGSDKGGSGEVCPAVKAVSITVGRTRRNDLADEVPVSLSGGFELEQNPESEPKLDMGGEDDQERGLEDLSVRVVLWSAPSPHRWFALCLPCGLCSGVGG